MRLDNPGSRSLAVLLTALMAAASVSVLALPAAAQDYAYSDSFGNLVVDSASGYKRIVVGKGYLADAVSSYGYEEPAIVRVYPAPRGQRYLPRRCEGAVIYHGRSYMYGLDRNETPILNPCP